MKVSAKELKKISIVDEIISEPLGGAHRNYDEVSESIKNSLLKNLKSLQKLSIDKLIERRYQRLLKIGS
jgi:acetyl-CoA carboxylase carboxyl transferase subunit alpha